MLALILVGVLRPDVANGISLRLSRAPNDDEVIVHFIPMQFT